MRQLLEWIFRSNNKTQCNDQRRLWFVNNLLWWIIYLYSNSQIAGLDSGETVSDYFNYLVKDDSGEYEASIPTDTEPAPYDKNSYGVLEILITGVDDETVNAAPTVTNDTAYVCEDFTVTALDGASANDGYSTSPFSSSYAISADSNYNSDHGDHTGDLLANDTDSDGDSLTITGKKKVFIDPLEDFINPFTDVGQLHLLMIVVDNLLQVIMEHYQ